MTGSRPFLRHAVIGCALLACLAAPAEADWLVTPFVGLKLHGQTNFLELQEGAGRTKVGAGVSAGFLTDGILGVELDLGYLPRFFNTADRGVLIVRSDVTTLTGNVLLAAPRALTRESLRPYLSVGLGLMHTSADEVLEVFGVDRNLAGVAIGVGALGGLSDRTSLRFDLRHFRNLGGDRSTQGGFGETGLSFWRASVGVTLSN